MKHFFYVIATVMALMGQAKATCSATLPAGSISMVYCNAESVVTYSPSATISDATAAAFVTWCEAKYAATASAHTAAGCFNAWSDDWVNQTIASILAAGQTSAAASAAAAVTPPAIVNQQ